MDEKPKIISDTRRSSFRHHIIIELPACERVGGWLSTARRQSAFAHRLGDTEPSVNNSPLCFRVPIIAIRPCVHLRPVGRPHMTGQE